MCLRISLKRLIPSVLLTWYQLVLLKCIACTEHRGWDLCYQSVPHRYHKITKLIWVEVSWALPQPPSSHPTLQSSRLFCEKKPPGFQVMMGSLADGTETQWAPLFPLAHGEAGIYCDHPIVFDTPWLVYPRYSHAAIIVWIDLLCMQVNRHIQHPLLLQKWTYRECFLLNGYHFY